MEDGYKLVLDPINGGYSEGFDRNATYEFTRPEWEEPHTFRMCDQPEWFNIWGLRYRPSPSPPDAV